jgi:hypothetical protein
VARPTTTFKVGDQVEVAQLSGWKAGTVLTANRLGPLQELYQVQVDGAVRTYRLDQVREPAACANCAALERKNKDLEAALDLARGELRKWIDAG